MLVVRKWEPWSSDDINDIDNDYDDDNYNADDLLIVARMWEPRSGDNDKNNDNNNDNDNDNNDSDKNNDCCSKEVRAKE